MDKPSIFGENNTQKVINKADYPTITNPTVFCLEDYTNMIDSYGLEQTWNIILEYISSAPLINLRGTFFDFDDIGEKYEIGLAYTNKITKKELGKYYTPIDVSQIMAQLILENVKIINLADVGCGTGNLIVSVIREAAKTNNIDIRALIRDGRLWLYDLDPLAVKICVVKIEILLNEKIGERINVIHGDFLDRKVNLPNNCSVITNPPYSVVKEFARNWFRSPVFTQARDLYAGFFDKILDKCDNAVIVSPQSFLVSEKFALLRSKLATHFYGEIFAFDNVPGTLFSGKKHGVFNTNNANGVRAAITSIKRNGHNGFRLTHLIRFRTNQRNDVLNLSFLRTKLGTKVQDLVIPLKSFKELEPLVEQVFGNPHTMLSEFVEAKESLQKPEFEITVSSSARYFTLGSKKTLDRKGCFTIYAKDEKSFKLLYALLNSSYVYMWWRFFDGGILFARRHFLNTPLSNDALDRINMVSELVDDMISNESKYISYKKNAGKNQESIKFPQSYRDKLNRMLFPEYVDFFDLLHNNFEVSYVQK